MKNYRQSTKPHARNPSQKVTQKTPNVAPKIIENPPKIDPWRASRTPWRPYLRQETFMYPIWLHFGPQMGPQNRPKIYHFLNLFLNDFLEPLFHAFGLHLGSQNDLQNETQKGAKTRTRKSLILPLFTTLEPH